MRELEKWEMMRKTGQSSIYKGAQIDSVNFPLLRYLSASPRTVFAKTNAWNDSWQREESLSIVQFQHNFQSLPLLEKFRVLLDDLSAILHLVSDDFEATVVANFLTLKMKLIARSLSHFPRQFSLSMQHGFIHFFSPKTNC